MSGVPHVAVEWFHDLGRDEEILQGLEGLKVEMLEAALWLSKPRHSNTVVAIYFDVFDGRIPLRVEACPQPGGLASFSLVNVEDGEELGIISLAPLGTLSRGELEERIRELCKSMGVDYEDHL